VWEAENTLVARKVAIKLLDPELAGDPVTRRRFLEEARAAGRIGHPNVVDVFDLGEQDRTPFLVMELCDGETLDAILRARGAVGVGYACELECQILSALEAAHAAGIVHRDLKPANVMVLHPQPDQPLVKVLDFGIATSVHGSGDGAGRVFGTPNYMAPEQAAGGPIDHRADIYAAGAILYELLGGKPPFVGDMPSLVLADVLTRPPIPLRAIDRSIPRELETLVRRTLAKDPDERPQTARELRKQIEELWPTARSSRPSAATLSEVPLPLVSRPAAEIELIDLEPAPDDAKPRLELVESSWPPREKE
jgi:serine/threonine-protein kinase